MVRKQYKKWEACWNENKIQKYQYFDNEQEAIKFENEKRALNKLQRQKQRQKQRQSKTKEQRRAEGLLKSGGNHECESEAIRKLVKLLENNWNIMLIRDGAHNDIALQKKDSPDTDLYYGVQIKSCSKQRVNGSHKTPAAQFNKINHYPNSLLICICLKPLKIWFFHGADLLNRKGLYECKKPYFKKALCYDEEEGINKLQDFLTTYLNNYQEHKLDYYNLQLNISHFLEDYANRLYKAHKNLPIVSKRRELNEIENSCVDCVDPDGSRIQEKICSVKIGGRIGFDVSLSKNNGMNIECKKTKGPYNENDFDILRIYLFCKVDELGKVSFKRERYDIKYNGQNYEKAIEDIKSYKLFGYFDIPINQLITKGCVSTKNQKGKTCLTVFLPEKIAEKIHYDLPKRIQKNSTIWTRTYFNLCMNLNKID